MSIFYDILVIIHLFMKSHSEGEKCVIVSGTSGPGPSTIKVWSHKPVSVPRYIYCLTHITVSLHRKTYNKVLRQMWPRQVTTHFIHRVHHLTPSIHSHPPTS